MVGLFTFFLVCLHQRKQLYTIPELTDPERRGDPLSVLQQINKQNKSVGLEITCTHVFSPIRALAWSFFPSWLQTGLVTDCQQWVAVTAKGVVTIWWTISKGDHIFYCLCYSSVTSIFLVKMINLSFLVSISCYD